MTRSRFIVANLVNRPLRSGLAVASFALMSAMFVSTAVLVDRATGGNTTFPGPRVVTVAYDGVPMPRSYADQIAALPDARGVEYQQRLLLTDDPKADKWAPYLWAVSDGWTATYPKQIVNMPAAVDKAWRENQQGVMASTEVAEHLHWKVGEPILLPIDAVHNLSGIYVGAVEFAQLTVIAHYDQVMRVLQGSNDLARLSTGCEAARCNALASEIDRHFETAAVATFSMSQENFLKQFDRRGATIPQLFLLIGIAIVGVCALVVTSSLLVALRSRSAEFATLRVLGYRRTQIFMLIVGETVFCAALGGIIGAMSLFVATQIHPVLLHQGGLPSLFRDMKVSLPLALAGVALPVVLGFVVSVVPTVQSLGRPIVTALLD